VVQLQEVPYSAVSGGKERAERGPQGKLAETGGTRAEGFVLPKGESHKFELEKRKVQKYHGESENGHGHVYRGGLFG